eukprot:3931596-Rhodomonas_salina.2
MGLCSVGTDLSMGLPGGGVEADDSGHALVSVAMEGASSPLSAYARAGTELGLSARSLRACYGVPGTEIGF